jgi:hypothetical protein
MVLIVLKEFLLFVHGVRSHCVLITFLMNFTIVPIFINKTYKSAIPQKIPLE